VPETGPTKSGEDQPQSTAALATRRRESLVELRARVAALESEQVELLEKLAFNLDVENGELQTTNQIDTPLESGSRVRKESMSPSYLARALIQIEDAVSEMENSMAIGWSLRHCLNSNSGLHRRYSNRQQAENGREVRRPSACVLQEPANSYVFCLVRSVLTSVFPCRHSA
jgi:hypothetical protein